MTGGRGQQPTAEMRELGSATDNRALAGHLAGANVDSWVDLLLNHCAQRTSTKGLMSIWKRLAVAYHQLCPAPLLSSTSWMQVLESCFIRFANDTQLSSVTNTL